MVPKLTVGDLLRQLQDAPLDDEIIFEGGMTFHRLKRRGSELLCIEFNEVQAFREKGGDPEVLVTFLKPS